MTWPGAYDPQATRVEQARNDYLRANGFTVESYEAPTFTLKFFGMPVRFSNRPSRKCAIPLHDLHHVATGYGTDWVGEAEIGAWELRSGCNSFVTYYLNGWAALIGLFLAPRRVLRAIRRARGQRTLYRAPIEYGKMLGMTVAELREHLHVPENGLADRPARLHRDAELRRLPASG